MKNLISLLPAIFFFLIACEKEEPVPSTENNFIANVSLPESISIQESLEIEVTIHKGTPCQSISEIVKTVAGNTFQYNFILEGSDTPCVTVVTEEVVSVNFDPSTSGEYTLEFSINGHLFETRTISVSEEPIRNRLEGQWTVVSFEDYETSTSITKTDVNTWSEFNDGDITVAFYFTENLSGEIAGVNVTNTFQGDFTVGQDREISIENVHWTEQSEPEWGQMFHNIVLAESYEFKDNRLIIYYNDRQNGIVLER